MKNKKLELYSMIHMYYGGIYTCIQMFILLILDHFKVISNSEFIMSFDAWIQSHSALEFVIYYIIVTYLVSLPHALVVYFKCLAQ